MEFLFWFWFLFLLAPVSFDRKKQSASASNTFSDSKLRWVLLVTFLLIILVPFFTFVYIMYF